jgi:hypothetical protein
MRKYLRLGMYSQKKFIYLIILEEGKFKAMTSAVSLGGVILYQFIAEK